MSKFVMCGYLGSHVIPPQEGCECVNCSPYQTLCNDCGEPGKRVMEQVNNGVYSIDMIKCKECTRRMIENQNG